MGTWIRNVWFVVYLLQLAIPVLGLLVYTFMSGGHFSLSNYQDVLSDPQFTSSLLLSLEVSVLAVVVAVVLITPTAWWAYLYLPKAVKVMEYITLVPFVIPGVILALGYVQFYSNPPFALSGTLTLLPFAFTVLAMPYMFQAVLNSLRSIDARSLTEASNSLGANWLRTFLTVVAPNLIPGIISGAILVFAICMGEFAITQLTMGGSFLTFPIYMQALFTSYPARSSTMAVLSYLITFFFVWAGAVIIPRLFARRLSTR